MKEKMVARTCVVCRKRDAKENLLRFVASREGSLRQVRVDANHQSEGRGAYCHSQCLGRAVERELIRSLRKTLPDGVQIREQGIIALLESGLSELKKTAHAPAVEKCLQVASGPKLNSQRGKPLRL